VVEIYDSDIWPIDTSIPPPTELFSKHYAELRRHIWLIEHPCAGNLDTNVLYGKWVGNATTHAYVEYNYSNWASWNPGEDYHYGYPIVKFRWGTGDGEVDIFIWHANTKGDKLNSNPPVLGGQINKAYWLLGADPNKYAHWNKNAGRPDLGEGAEDRWRLQPHGWDPPPDGVGWAYGRWETWRELPIHTDPFEQVPHVKVSSIDRAQHSPVEPKRNWITTRIKPTMNRSYTDGYVGIIPNHTWWIHHFDRSKVSEYVYVGGEPVGSIQVGRPNYVDPKFNQSMQDRILYCIEANYQYLKAIDPTWLETWQHWVTYGVELDHDHDDGCVNKHPEYAGTSTGPHYQGVYTYGDGAGPGADYPVPGVSMSRAYAVGNVVWWWNRWWRCIKAVAYSSYDYSPTGSLGAGVYWQPDGEPLHQPTHIASDPVYVQFSDYLFRCNSSAWEKVLEEISKVSSSNPTGTAKYDWWWCERAEGEYPAEPWWLYNAHYYWMTRHRADPDATPIPHNVTAQTQYPLTSGCWRKVPRYSQCWDKDRPEGHKARLGKVIDIDGEQVSMMWPGDLGDPPGMEYLNVYYGVIASQEYNYRQMMLVITDEQWDAMKRPVGYEWQYTQFFVSQGSLKSLANPSGIGKSMEDLFREAYRLQKTAVENRLKERHDPTDTEWLDDGAGNWNEYPVFEIKPDLINDLKAALEQLKLFGQDATIDVVSIISTDIDQPNLGTSLAVYRNAKTLCDNMTSGYDETAQYTWGVGYMACVWCNSPTEYTGSCGGGNCTRWTDKYWARIEITQEANTCFPATSVGQATFDVFARGVDGMQKINDYCTIGVGDFRYKPTSETPKRVYSGSVPVECNWVYDVDTWKKICTFEVKPEDPWPDEVHFDWVGSAGECKSYSRQSAFELVYSDHFAWSIDFDGYDSDVFEQDPTNFIEVT